ncbi:MAG: hypothetical protein DYH15_13015 [Nitrosomonas sp. PRO4]|nr:hypothetical protein [Nitrosomonas sp. PRO4]
MFFIINLIKTIINEGFVQYLDNKLVFKGGEIDLSGVVGGGSNIPIIAYASAPDGTGFSLVPGAGLGYIAITVLPQDTTPAVAHFANLWQRWKGDPGQAAEPLNGTNGEPGGIRMNLSTITTEAKPGTGKVAFNNADISLATEMYVDEMMPSAVDLSGFWDLIESGWYVMIKPATNINKPLAMIKITGANTDNGDWFKYPIQVLSMSNETFSDGDKLVLQFFGGGGAAAAVTEAAIIAAGNFPRYSNTGGIYKLIDTANAEIKAASQVFKLPGFTITGVTDLPAANTFPHGSVVRLHQDILVGAGSNPLGVYVVADAVNNIWRPWGQQILFAKTFGDLAAATCSLSAAGKFNLGGTDPVIPAGLLHASSVLRLIAKMRKVNATTPTVRANLGTDLAARENNSIVYQNQFTATQNINLDAEPSLSFVSATKLVSTRAATRGGGGAANTFLDCATLINIASDMKLTFEASTLASDTVDLLEFMLIWEK